MSLTLLLLCGLLGIAYGVVLQRSGFCFAKAVFELFLLRSRDALNGIILGMLVATIGFGVVTLLRQQAGLDLTSHLLILPLGAGTALGGLLFGLGMTLAGMCAAGTLQRLGEGYLIACVTLVGAIIGTALDPFRLLLPVGWKIVSPGLWLGGSLGVIPAFALTALVLALSWWLVSGRFACVTKAEVSRLRLATQQVITSPTARGGMLLGGLSTLQMALFTPWTVAYPLALVASATSGTLTQTALQLALPFIALDVGVVAGVLLTAAFSHDLHLRRPRRMRDITVALGGGVLMGWGIELAGGCSIGGVFSAIPSLSLSGWLFFPALCLGGWLGTLIVRRLL